MLLFMLTYYNWSRVVFKKKKSNFIILFGSGIGTEKPTQNEEANVSSLPLISPGALAQSSPL